MSKKLFLSLIISLIFVLCTSIGFGAWIIVNQVTVSPNYSNESVRKIITPKVIELDYTTEDDGNGNMLPIKWDTFKTAVSTSAKVICETSTGTEVTLTAGTDITLNISAMNNGDIYYGTAVNGLTAGHTYVVGSTYITNATVTLTENGLKDYKAFNNNNYDVLVKYKSAKLKGSYYTVEDAIAEASTSDTITFDGVAVLESYTVTSGSTTTTHYRSIYSDTCRTSFTNLSTTVTGYSDDNYNLKGKLRVPFANVDMDYHGSGGETSVTKPGLLFGTETSTDGCDRTFVQAISTRDPATGVYSVLIIPENVALNVATTGNFIVGGLVQAQGAVTNRGVVMNEGTINVNGNLGSYGYLKGNGTVNFNSGAKGIDVFRIYDWGGGALAGGLNKENVFPVNAYSIHNISCNTIINAGSSYEAFWTVKFSNRLYGGYQRGDKDDKLQDKDGNVKLVGKTGTSSLFELTSGSIIKTANGGRGSTATTLNNALNNVTGSNTTKGQMDVYTINGNCTDNTISISITASGQSFNMETSTDIALPVGFMDVIVNDGGTLNITSASYKFLPGSSLTIEDGGVLNVSNSATLAFCDVAYATQDATKFINQSVNDVDAFATINGDLNIASGSSIGGKLLTVGSTGNLNISGNATASILLTTSIEEGSLMDTAHTISYSLQAKGPVYNYNGNTENATLSNIIHTAKNSAWLKSTATINYNANDGTLTGSASENCSIDYNNGYTINAINTTNPTKTHYDFAGWYLDSACTQSAIGATIWGDTTVYAKWTPTVYSVTYNIVYEEGATSTNFVNPNANNSNGTTTFTVEQGLPIDLVGATDGSLLFFGWYSDANFTTPITTINTLNNVTVYAYFTDTLKHSVTFNKNNSEYVGNNIIQQIEDGAFATVPTFDTTTHDNNPVKQTYFDGNWYTDAQCTTLYDFNTPVTEDITLYAGWIDKVYIEVIANYADDANHSYNLFNEKLWYKAGTFIVDMSDYGTVDDYDKQPNHEEYFNGWSGSDGETYTVTSSFTLNSSVTLTATWANKVPVTVTHTQQTGGMSSTTARYTIIIYDSNDEQYFTESYTNESLTAYIIPNHKFKFSNVSSYGSNTLPTSNVVVDKDTTYEYSISSRCIVEGTLITLADGSQKKVEDLTTTDELLIFNHETGKYEVGYMWFNDTEEAADYRIINLEFSDGTVVKVVYKHGFFDLTLNKYVAITENNVNEFVGHRFYTSTWNGEEFVEGEITLTRAYLTTEYVKVYSPITVYHFNYFTENLLSMPSMNFDMDEVLNIFEYDEDLKYDEEKMQADIEKYGLFTYEELQDYIPYEVYELTPIKYWKIAIGKGLITFEDIINTAELLKDKGFM